MKALIPQRMTLRRLLKFQGKWEINTLTQSKNVSKHDARILTKLMLGFNKKFEVVIDLYTARETIRINQKILVLLLLLHYIKLVSPNLHKSVTVVTAQLTQLYESASTGDKNDSLKACPFSLTHVLVFSDQQVTDHY